MSKRTAPKSKLAVAYLGPAGTYSHIVAERYFGKSATMVAQPTVSDVCAFVSGHAGHRGIVPIENSSGGTIYETVDILLHGQPRVHILAELSLDVKLALLGRTGQEIRTLYSHFVPLEHCSEWIRANLPKVQKQVVTSTAVAARHAFLYDNAAALGDRGLAARYNLDVLRFPIQADIPNITSFLAIAGGTVPVARASKCTLAVRLPNTPGSLCTFLDQFRAGNVNLSRILSRPVRGCPREYAFMVDLDGSLQGPAVQRALRRARKVSVEIRVVGSYPSLPPYHS